MSLLAGAFIHIPKDRKPGFLADFKAFTDDKIHPDRLPQLMQDVLDCGALPLLPRRFAVAAQHCFDHGYVYVPGVRGS